MLLLPPELAAVLLAEAPDLLSTHAPDGAFQWASAATQAILGYAPEAVVGRLAQTFAHPDDRQLLAHTIRDTLADPPGAPARRVLYRAIRADGASIWLEGHGRAVRPTAPMVGGADETPHLFFVTRDVSASVRAALPAIPQSATLQATGADSPLALAADAAAIGVSVREIGTQVLSVSPAFARVYGLPPETRHVALQTLLDLTHPDDRRTIRPVFEAALNEPGNTAQTQFRIRRADTGEERTLLSTARAEGTADGRVARILSVTLDVSELAEARVAAEQQAYWQRLIDGLPEILWVSDSSSQITQLLNQRWFEYTGQTSEVLLNQTWNRAFHPVDLAEILAKGESLARIAAGEPYEVKFRIRRHDGAWRWFLARAVPLPAPDGSIANWVGLTMDIHERELAEQRLRRANADLDTFVYTAAHDLKSPIDNLEAIISGLYEEISSRRAHFQDALLDASQDVLLDHATRAIGRFRATLADLAQVVDTQIEADGPVEALNLTTQVADIVLDMEAEFAAAHGFICLDLRIATLRALPARHLRSVLFNLISNALKYRSPGRPARLLLRTRPIGAGRVELSLSDNGLGLDPQRAARAFELFGRLHPGAAGGTGIGLFIVRRIVEQAGGQLQVRGRPGEGTTFAIRFPVS